MQGRLRYIILCALGGLAGCAHSPAPAFFGAQRSETSIDGYRFVVYQKHDQAEVIRLGYLTPRQRDPVPKLMIRAAEQITHCKVLGPLTGTDRSPSLPGDTGEARFDLDCGAKPATPRAR